MVIFHSYLSLPEGTFPFFEDHPTLSLVSTVAGYGGWPTPLKNMSSSVGIIFSQSFPIYMEKNVPNHQPAIGYNPFTTCYNPCIDMFL